VEEYTGTKTCVYGCGHATTATSNESQADANEKALAQMAAHYDSCSKKPKGLEK